MKVECPLNHNRLNKYQTCPLCFAYKDCYDGNYVDIDMVLEYLVKKIDNLQDQIDEKG